MALSRLQINQVRNLETVQLDALAPVNVFYGANGSGKTSILEAIHLLGMARSFRGNSVKSLITHERSDCTVFGLVHSGAGSMPLGIRRQRAGEVQIKVAGKPVQTVAELVEHLPVQVINADSFNLLTGTPGARRQYLDWGVFHVEHRFFSQWQRFQRSIKQRNKLLRHAKMADVELSAWSRDLAESGEAISAFRQSYFDELTPRFLAIADRIVPALKGRLAMRYRRGWDLTETYHEALERSKNSDIEHGYTHVGPQRADIRVTVDGHLAADTLSRGQQKLVVCALKLAQGQVMATQRQHNSLYLVDDLPSELDSEHCQLVCEQLASLPAQVFITCVDKDDITAVWPASAEPIAMFHVEHGSVAAQNELSNNETNE
jgi:DNA replication and repair protein RecF